MKKLNQKKVKWVVREMDKGERSVYRIAKTMKITPQWAREIHRTYHKTGEYPFPQKPGRRPRPISEVERNIILEVRKKHPISGKWIRYQRRYSNSLWHADWFEQRQDKVILFEDDASRFITGYGVFGNATTKNTIYVLEEALQGYGTPKQLMTDHGPQFTSLPRETCADPQPNQFQQTLKIYGITHIKPDIMGFAGYKLYFSKKL
jgi:transposase